MDLLYDSVHISIASTIVDRVDHLISESNDYKFYFNSTLYYYRIIQGHVQTAACVAMNNALRRPFLQRITRHFTSASYMALI